MASLALETLLLYIAANCRRLRKRRGLTQEALAEVAGLDLRFVQKIESGRHNMSLSALLAVANALDVPPGLLFRSSTMPEVKRGRPREKRPT